MLGKKIRLFVFLFLFSVQADFAMAQKPVQLILSNTLPLARPDELVVLKRADIEKKLGSITGYLGATVKGKPVAVQHDDLDRDGRWDEAVLLLSFASNETIAITILKKATAGDVAMVQRAHVRLRKQNGEGAWGQSLPVEDMPLRNPATDFSKQALPLYLTEGPAWENDKVGFRLYFDVRNGKDIWGKRTSRMVLDSVGTKASPSYHNFSDWGMDVLHAGKSLGAGSLALLVQSDSGADTLIRLGGKEVMHETYRQLADGPLRAVFQMDYHWQINGKPLALTEQVSICGGQYFYESKVWVNNAPKNAKLVVGIASFYDNVFQSYQSNKTNVLFSYGRQSENKDNLGLAVLVPSRLFAFAASALHTGSDVLDSYLSAQTITDEEPCRFRFVAGWEKSDQRFATFHGFKNYLDGEAGKMAESIRVKWQ